MQGFGKVDDDDEAYVYPSSGESSNTNRPAFSLFTGGQMVNMGSTFTSSFDCDCARVVDVGLGKNSSAQWRATWR